MEPSFSVRLSRFLAKVRNGLGLYFRVKVGRFYEDRYGNVVGPMQRTNGPTYWFSAPGYPRTWTKRGTYLVDTRHGYDLMREVKGERNQQD